MMKRIPISFNSPVILGITGISLLVLVINTLSGGILNSFFAIHYTSWADPLMYLRLFTHVVAHLNLTHYTNNFLFILAVGPLIEKKYGSKNLVIMFCITSLITGLVNIIFFKNIALLGASGLVFMLILLASFTNIKSGKMPLTFLLVGLLYIGNEIAAGLASSDNISQISHIVGGLCGAGFGFFFHSGNLRMRGQ